MIKIGQVIGGSRADYGMKESCQRLKNLLHEHTDKEYGDSLKHLAIVICVSGNIRDYDFEGFDRIRIDRKRKQLWMDFGIRNEFFKNKTEDFINKFLIKIVEDALEHFFQRIDKDKLKFDKHALTTDFQKVSAKFLQMELMK